MGCQHHHHNHHEDPPSLKRWGRLQSVLVLTTLYLFAEVVGGLLTGSLALLADAGHMLADVGGLALALFALWIAQYPASSHKTYGYYRMEILAALLNGLFLAGLSVGIIVEAVQRWQSPPVVEATPMFWVALGGFFVNVIAVWILHGSSHENLNMKGAYLHVLGDLLGSVGTVISALLMMFQGIYWVDPFASILIACLVLVSAGKLLWEASHILLEGTPAHINVPLVKEAMLGLCGVVAVHDLHVWTISSGKDALSAHIVVEKDAYKAETLSCLQKCLKEEFGLSHLTLQLEPPDFEEDEIHF